MRVIDAPGVGPPEVVFQADDVVLAEVGAVLHLNEDDVGVAELAMRWAAFEGDVDGLPRPQLGHRAVQGHLGRPRHDEPVLGPLGVALVAEPLARVHHDALDLVVGRVIVSTV
jgi:hypothetical protein